MSSIPQSPRGATRNGSQSSLAAKPYTAFDGPERFHSDMHSPIVILSLAGNGQATDQDGKVASKGRRRDR